MQPSDLGGCVRCSVITYPEVNPCSRLARAKCRHWQQATMPLAWLTLQTKTRGENTLHQLQHYLRLLCVFRIMNNDHTMILLYKFSACCIGFTRSFGVPICCAKLLLHDLDRHTSTSSTCAPTSTGASCAWTVSSSSTTYSPLGSSASRALLTTGSICFF